MDCRHGKRSHSGLAIHGDIDVYPPDCVPSRWEMEEADPLWSLGWDGACCAK